MALDLDALTPRELRARRSLKWNRYPEDVLPLWVAEMDYPTAAPIKARLRRAVAVENFGYPLDAQASGLADAVVHHQKGQYGWAVDPSGVHAIADVMHGVSLAIKYFSRPADLVVIPTPLYMPFFEVVQLTGRPQVHVPMVWDDRRWTLDLGSIDAALSVGARTVVLCNPHNPLGRVFARVELMGLADIVHRHGARVISDEVHAPLAFDRVHVPYASLDDRTAGHTITVTSASKAWNLPGLRCAQAITSNPADTAAWARIPLWETIGVATMGLEASLAAYEQGGEWLAQVTEKLDVHRSLVADALSGMPGVRHVPNEGTYLAWLDCRELGLPGEPAGWFLEHAKVALSPGRPFRGPAGHARLNFATTTPILEQALERMATAVSRVAGSR
jgi:cystathionine beta-lyase